MGKHLVLRSCRAAIVRVVWSAIAWMLIPWPGEPLRTFTNEDAVAQAIKANTPRSGNYLLPNEPKRTPGMTNEQYQKMEQEATDRMSRGPVIFAAVRLEPFGSMVKPLVIGFIIQFIAALLATFLLLQPSALSDAGRVVFLIIIGVIIFVGGHLDEWNWWSFSNAYMAMQAGAIVIGWALASFVMATVVRGKLVTV